MIDVSKLIPGDRVLVPTELGINREVTIHHTFEANGVHYAVAEWRNHFGQFFFSVYDSNQIRGVVDAK